MKRRWSVLVCVVVGACSPQDPTSPDGGALVDGTQVDGAAGEDAGSDAPEPGPHTPRCRLGLPTAPLLETGEPPLDIAVGDLDGNGALDVVVVLGKRAVVEVLLQNPDGSFQRRVEYPAGLSPSSLAIGDINGDGVLDVAIASHTDVSFTLLRGSGDGTLVHDRTVSLIPEPPPVDIAVADVNGDDKADVFIVHALPSFASLFLTTPSDEFQPRGGYDLGPPQGNSAIAIADLTGDGRAELIGVSNLGTHTINVNNGTGVLDLWHERPIGKNARAVAAGDVDGDGNVDTVVAFTNPGRVAVLKSNPGGAEHAPRVTVVNGTPVTLGLEDIDGDGTLDIIVSHEGLNTLTVLLNRREDRWEQRQVSVGGAPVALVLADMNRDGKPDLVTINQLDSTVSITPNLGNGAFPPRFVAGVPPASSTLALGDIDGDGRLDAALGQDQIFAGVAALRNRGDGSFVAQAVPLTTEDNHQVVLVDLDGDHYADLVATSRSLDAVNVWMAAADRTFRPPVRYFTDRDPLALATADLDADGHPDLVTGNGDGTISVRLGSGDGTLGSLQTYRTTDALHGAVTGLAIADLIGDDHLDLVVADADRETLTVLVGNGRGGFEIATTLHAPEPASLAVGDVNADGHVDLVTTGIESGAVAIWLNGGADMFMPTVVASPPGRALSVTTGDVTDDGIADIVVNIDGDWIAVLPGSINDSFQDWQLYAAGPVPGKPAVGDLDHDGVLDVVVVNQRVATVTTLLATCLP